MELVIKINLDNAAFEHPHDEDVFDIEELEDVLHTIVEDLDEKDDIPNFSLKMQDANGNSIGEAFVTD